MTKPKRLLMFEYAELNAEPGEHNDTIFAELVSRYAPLVKELQKFGRVEVHVLFAYLRRNSFLPRFYMAPKLPLHFWCVNYENEKHRMPTRWVRDVMLDSGIPGLWLTTTDDHLPQWLSEYLQQHFGMHFGKMLQGHCHGGNIFPIHSSSKILAVGPERHCSIGNDALRKAYPGHQIIRLDNESSGHPELFYHLDLYMQPVGMLDNKMAVLLADTMHQNENRYRASDPDIGTEVGRRLSAIFPITQLKVPFIIVNQHAGPTVVLSYVNALCCHEKPNGSYQIYFPDYAASLTRYLDSLENALYADRKAEARKNLEFIYNQYKSSKSQTFESLSNQEIGWSIQEIAEELIRLEFQHHHGIQHTFVPFEYETSLGRQAGLHCLVREV